MVKRIRLLPPTLIVALSALLSKLLGVYRDHLLAKTFGASAGTGLYDLDVYYAAFRVPDLIYSLLVFGAVSAAFIPIFTQYKKEGEKRRAWEFASSMLHLVLFGVFCLSVIVFIFAPYLAKLVAGGFDAEQLALTTRLMRILLLSPLLFSVASIFIAIQDSFKSFFYRSLAPLFYNLGIIIGIISFADQFGVVGVTWGVILGAGLQLLVQVPGVRELGYKHVWMLGRRRDDVKAALRLMVPRVLGLSVTQLTLIVNTLIASFLMGGSITVFYLADNLQALPLGMIGISFAITSFATLSELASEPTKEPFAAELKRVMGIVFFLIIPATIGMLVLRQEVVDVILNYGKFSQQDAELTALVLGLLALSLFAQSLVPLLGRGFYAYQNTKTPLLTALAGAAVSIGGALIFTFQLGWGIAGIAAAYSLGHVVNFVLIFILMRRHLREPIVDWANSAKIILISVIMGSLVYLTKIQVPFMGPFGYELGLVLVYTAWGMMIYGALCYWLKVPEFRALLKNFEKRA